MFRVFRKLFGGVLAISLILFHSVLGFAAVYDFTNSFPAFSRVRFMSDSQEILNYNAYYISSSSTVDSIHYPTDGNLTKYSNSFSSFDSSSNLGFWLYSEDVAIESSNGNSLFYDSVSPASGFYTIVFSFSSSNDISSLMSTATQTSRFLASTEDYRFTPENITYDFSFLRPQNPTGSNDKYLNYITINFFLPSFPFRQCQFNYYLYHDDFSIQDIDNLSVSTSFLSNIDYTDKQDSLLLTLQKGFDKVISSLFGFRDADDQIYTTITDPSTSEEIQEAQGMIDTVENFESQLHSNIVTEFDKIDFTTPTNLAAPVAYVGDKITRSMNSLGNYQPLVFVPLVLGIMLIMLGRGVSALGSFGSAATRASRTDGLDTIRNNPRDERWLY